MQNKNYVMQNIFYCNPNFRLMIEARGCKVMSQDKDPKVTSHAPGNAKSVRE
jgi:hypothetical protein